MSDRDDDSDAPEEFTSEQGLRQDEEIRKVQRENKARYAFFFFVLYFFFWLSFLIRCNDIETSLNDHLFNCFIVVPLNNCLFKSEYCDYTDRR
ncbi:unnamed protein product, partial [Vitis vinifera]